MRGDTFSYGVDVLELSTADIVYELPHCTCAISTKSI